MDKHIQNWDLHLLSLWYACLVVSASENPVLPIWVSVHCWIYKTEVTLEKEVVVDMCWFLWRNSVYESGKKNMDKNQQKKERSLIWQYRFCYSYDIGESDMMQKNSPKANR